MNRQEDVNRFQLWLQLVGLAITFATALGVTYVKNELAETRILIMEKISIATKDLVQRREFDALERRVSGLESRRDRDR